MTNDQINRAIAEVCGWTEIGICDCGFKISGIPPYRSAHKKHIPDYCADLNEMHDAEKTLTDDQWHDYVENVGGFCQQVMYATARQRAEAFLRTIGKWEEVQP